MVRDPHAGTEPPDVDAVLDVLHDEDCRTIIRHLEEPLTAKELSEACDIPRSTIYRKLEKMTDASLLREGVAIRADGSHASRYDVAFRELVVRRDEDGELSVDIDRPARRSDERLAELWSEVRKEL